MQIMYFVACVGEAPEIASMLTWVHGHAYTPSGKHHEIFLSDPRKIAPEKNKTILRQPVRKF